MSSLKDVTDKLLDTFSTSNLAPIALKVSAKYNDGAVATELSPKPPVLRDIDNIADEALSLFDNSDRAFVGSLVPSEDLSAIADEIGFEIVEEFNS